MLRRRGAAPAFANGDRVGHLPQASSERPTMTMSTGNRWGSVEALRKTASATCTCRRAIEHELADHYTIELFAMIYSGQRRAICYLSVRYHGFRLRTLNKSELLSLFRPFITARGFGTPFAS
jgi:hypothetical protein